MAPAGDVITTPYLRMTWGGTLGEPAIEQWSNTVKWFGFEDAEPTPAQVQAGADAAAVPLQAWFTSVNSHIGNAAKLGWLKLNWVGADGLQVETNTIRHDWLVPLSGASNNGAIWEQTYCLTLRTGLSRGRAHSGRIFPPVSGEPLSSTTPYVSAQVATDMAASFAAALAAIKTAMDNAMIAAGMPSGQGYSVGVISDGSREKGTEPRRAVFTGVVCDRVPDIQHRRTKNVQRNEATFAPLPNN